MRHLLPVFFKKLLRITIGNLDIVSPPGKITQGKRQKKNPSIIINEKLLSDKKSEHPCKTNSSTL